MSDDKRVHNIDKAGGGNLGPIPDGAVLGPCPSCHATLHVSEVRNPRSGRVESGLMHPVPFCSYFGETDADVITRAIDAAKR